eukprot:GHVT01062572.1.p1 GENE.GHVT01062572.1~~GHVT01062572.1.p1  ORF type:complete len:282 (+),score=19.50 GHVT01062572.1:604-1449(+)
MVHYKKIKEIGQGSFGKAIMVEDADTRKNYVMKVINMGAMDKKTQDSTLNEAKILASMKPHPYIVQYHQSYIHEKQLCIIMQYCGGGELYGRIKTQRKKKVFLSEDVVCRWFTQLALGLKYLHEKHILHRDLKTQNVFLDDRGDALIGDFGIAKVLESTMAQAATAIGTPYYLSPELIRGEKYSFPSDVWALGCILYELCVLRVPFDAPSIKELGRQIINDPIPVLDNRWSPELSDLLKTILQRDPRKRPTANDIVRHPMVQRMVARLMDETKQRSRNIPQ